MSKKLMMNNYSENGLMPVMDGLVCWLDGRDGKNGDTVWKDRSGNGNNLPITNAYFENDCLNMNVNSSLGNFVLSKEFTFHVCLKSNVYNEYQNIYDNDEFEPRNFVMLWIDWNYKLECNANTKCKDIMKDKINIIDSVRNYSNTRVYQEGSLTAINSRSGTVPSKVSLFTRKGLQGLSGEIYSLLIYNRALTEEEIQQNYLYEQSIERGE